MRNQLRCKKRNSYSWLQSYSSGTKAFWMFASVEVEREENEFMFSSLSPSMIVLCECLRNTISKKETLNSLPALLFMARGNQNQTLQEHLRLEPSYTAFHTPSQPLPSSSSIFCRRIFPSFLFPQEQGFENKFANKFEGPRKKLN